MAEALFRLLDASFYIYFPLLTLRSVLFSSLHFIVLRAPEYNAQDSDDKPEETQQAERESAIYRDRQNSLQEGPDLSLHVLRQ
jgi:hypothetical protein